MVNDIVWHSPHPIYTVLLEITVLSCSTILQRKGLGSFCEIYQIVGSRSSLSSGAGGWPLVCSQYRWGYGSSLPFLAFKKSSIGCDLSTPMHTKCFMESVLLQYTAEPEDGVLFTLSSFTYLLLIHTAKCGFS